MLIALTAAVLFNIPPGSFFDASEMWLQQAGPYQLLWRTDDLAACPSPGVRGVMTLERALRVLLSGTPGVKVVVSSDEPEVISVIATRQCPPFCHPEWGPRAPLPPCQQPPLEVRRKRSRQSAAL